MVLKVGMVRLSTIVCHIAPMAIVLTLIWIGRIGSVDVASSGLGLPLEIPPILIGQVSKTHRTLVVLGLLLLLLVG